MSWKLNANRSNVSSSTPSSQSSGTTCFGIHGCKQPHCLLLFCSLSFVGGAMSLSRHSSQMCQLAKECKNVRICHLDEYVWGWEEEMGGLTTALKLKGSAYTFCNNSKCLSDCCVPGTVLGTEQSTGKPKDELVMEPALWSTPSLLLRVHISLRFRAAG